MENTKVSAAVSALRDVKRQEKWTALTLATAAGLSVRTVENFLTGWHSMPLAKFEAMLDVLGYKVTIEPK